MWATLSSNIRLFKTHMKSIILIQTCLRFYIHRSLILKGLLCYITHPYYYIYNYSILLFFVILCKYIEKKSNTQLHLFSLSFLAFSGSNSSQVHHFGLQHVSNCAHSIHVMRLDVLINRLIKNCRDLRKRNAYNIHKDLLRYNSR